VEYIKIIISGKRGTGKTTLFWGLQKQLSWPTFSVSQFLRDYIFTHGLSNKVEDINSRSEEITREIDNRIIELLKGDYHVIVETRVFGYIYEQFPDTLKVLLVCDDIVRINRYAFRQGISQEEARKRLFKKEDEWFEKMKKLYNRDDFFNNQYYDLVIDTTNLIAEQIQSLVLAKLKSL